MHSELISMFDRHGIMTIATLRPDGWPQATTVSYVNDGLILYFLISRTSQKFSNIAADDRVAITITSEPNSVMDIHGLSLAAKASEARDEPFRSTMLAKLSARHPGYFDPAALDMTKSALMRANPTMITMIDFSKGLGHTETVTVGTAEMTELLAERPDNWGATPAG